MQIVLVLFGVVVLGIAALLNGCVLVYIVARAVSALLSLAATRQPVQRRHIVWSAR